jgi:UDP-N-acetyl-2-amino-2-deoxyglucuronate dehydrogenase
MKPALRFAVVGCGRISEKHLSAITSEHVGGELVAVCDLNEANAQAAAEKYKTKYYLNYHEMMQKHPEIDVVNVLTPTGYHAEHVIDLAQYGRHIVTEKPMALTVADCQQMIAATHRHGGRLFVVKQNRFNRAVQVTRQAYEQGRFGKLVMVTSRVRWRRTQQYYAQGSWRGTWELDGGVMSQQASHHLDLLQWFLGPIETLQCQIATRLMQIEVEDTATAMFKAKSGALGAFEATVATRPEDLEGSLSILGEKGSVIIGGPAVNIIEYWNFEETLPGDASVRQEFSQNVPNVYGHGHVPYLAHVAEAIVKDQPAMVDGEEGKKNIEILMALYESAAVGGLPRTPGCPVVQSKLGRRPIHSIKEILTSDKTMKSKAASRTR